MGHITVSLLFKPCTYSNLWKRCRGCMCSAFSSFLTMCGVTRSESWLAYPKGSIPKLRS